MRGAKLSALSNETGTNTSIYGNNNKGVIVTSEEIINKAKIFENATPDLVVTSDDRLYRFIREYTDALKSQRDWITPLGMLLAILPTLVAAEFKKFLGISPDTWSAIFILSGVICTLWLLLSLITAIKLRKKINVDDLINKIKSHR